MKNAIVLVSGGIDSATCCVLAKKDGFALFAMSFEYGQRHLVELDAARKVVAFSKAIEHRIVTIDLRSFGGSSLTSNTDVPKDRDTISDKSIPSTYVPARNTIFLSFALGWAEVLDIFDIYIGVNAVDYSGYPDCRPEYICAYQTMANLATRNSVEGKQIKIHTPLISLSKSDIIRTGASLGMDYSLTHSCYDPSSDGLACGRCDSCNIRRKGFLDAKIPDPTRYYLRTI